MITLRVVVAGASGASAGPGAGCEGGSERLGLADLLIGSGSGTIGRRTVFRKTGSVETCAALAVELGGWICIGGAKVV